MTNNFPLFKLPHLAIHEVLNHVGSEVMLLLSLCSKRSKRLLKLCQGPRKETRIILNILRNLVEVDYGFSGLTAIGISISIAAVSKLPKNMNLETVNIGSHVVPVQIEDHDLKTYWIDKKEGLKEIVKHASDVFSSDLYSIEGCSPSFSPPDYIRHWLKWIKTRQGKLCRLSMSYKVDDDLLMDVLESDVATSLDLHTRPSSTFRGPPPRPYSIDYLSHNQSNWVTLNHLLAMDIKKISLQNSSLTCQEINTFLKKWINGEFSKRIKEFFVAIETEVNDDVLMEGIEVNRRDPSVERAYASSRNYVEHINGGFDIRRKEDGAMATILAQGMQGRLHVLFWPDYKGNLYH